VGDGARILVVDDDERIAEMLARALSRHGFRVDATASSEEALRFAQEQPYDAALVDLVMPGLDGALLSDALRRLYPDLPIGLLTGYAHTPLVEAAARGRSKLFKKPVEIQDVVDFLKAEVQG